MQLDEFSGDVAPYAEYRRLAAEQAAVRRLATLVARGVEPWEVFDAVTNEMCRCANAESAGLWRYETSDEITMVAAAYHPAAEPVHWPVGARTPTAANTLASMVQRSGRPARMDSYENVAGSSRYGCVRWASGLRWVSRSSSMDACGAWRRSVRHDRVRCRPTPRSASAASPNLSRVSWWRDTAMSRKGSSWVMYLSVRCWLIRCSRGDPLIAGACGKSRAVCGCRPVVRSWSSPRRFPPWVCEALPEVESKLRGRDVYSAWRLQPDLQVGIVHVKSERQLDEILGLVSSVGDESSRRQFVFRRSA